MRWVVIVLKFYLASIDIHLSIVLIKFCFRVVQYTSAFSVFSILAISATLWAVMRPQTITEPPPCFIVAWRVISDPWPPPVALQRDHNITNPTIQTNEAPYFGLTGQSDATPVVQRSCLFANSSCLFFVIAEIAVFFELLLCSSGVTEVLSVFCSVHVSSTAVLHSPVVTILGRLLLTVSEWRQLSGRYHSCFSEQLLNCLSFKSSLS